MRTPCLLAALAGLLALAGPLGAQTPQARKVEGVEFATQQLVAGKTLQLNGAGVRKKFFVKVYAAGLYTPQAVQQVAQVWDSPGPKRLAVVALREIDASSLGKAMAQTMADNLPKDKMPACIAGLVRTGEVFAEKKRLLAGEGFTLDEVPGQGTVISINGQVAALIEGTAFFSCLMYNYFGDRPADTGLKQALLAGQ